MTPRSHWSSITSRSLSIGGFGSENLSRIHIKPRRLPIDKTQKDVSIGMLPSRLITTSEGAVESIVMRLTVARDLRQNLFEAVQKRVLNEGKSVAGGISLPQNVEHTLLGLNGLSFR